MNTQSINYGNLGSDEKADSCDNPGLNGWLVGRPDVAGDHLQHLSATDGAVWERRGGGSEDVSCKYGRLKVVAAIVC